jgi:hypothetical protein
VVQKTKLKAGVQASSQKEVVMKKWILICLIAFIPQADFSPEFLEVLKQIYFEKHPGVTKAHVVVSETKSGLIRVEIDQPKTEL